MKKNILILSLLLALATSAITNVFVYAQEPECRDAAGAVIPCPPTEEPASDGETGNGGGGSGNQNPPTVITALPSSTPSPEPTNTPLPIDNPTEETEAAGAEWSGTCKGTTKEVARCIGLFTNGCEHVGGTVSAGEIKNGEVPLTCKVSSVALTPEVAPLAAAPSNPQPEPEPQPTPGTFPPGGWQPWLAGFFGLVIGLLVPAVQKVREAAASRTTYIGSANGGIWKNRDASESQTREHILLNKDDGNTSDGSKPKPKPAPKPRPSSGDFDSDGDVDGRDFNHSSTSGTSSASDVIVTREDKDRR